MPSGKRCEAAQTTRMLAQRQPYIKRVRNSSLVEWLCAEDITGLSIQPKLRNRNVGRGASNTGRSTSGSTCGLYSSENAGMSSENYVGIIMAENLRFLGEGSSAQGKPGAKTRPKGVADAHTVEIPWPPKLKHQGHIEIAGPRRW